MIEIKSERAKKILNQPRFLKTERDELMKKFPGNSMMLWVSIEWEHHNVKNLSFFGELEKFQIVLVESMASLLINKPIAAINLVTRSTAGEDPLRQRYLRKRRCMDHA